MDNISVIGLGFVGSAMAIACASSQAPLHVTGVDIGTAEGLRRIDALNNGEFPFGTTDEKLLSLLDQASTSKRFNCETGYASVGSADVVIVDVHFDVGDMHGDGNIDFSNLETLTREIGTLMQPGALLLVETTVPPGTCEKIVRPILTSCELDRGLPSGSLLLAHSYERVMPGSNYIDSIINFWRVYASDSEPGAQKCEAFLSTIINTEEYPLSRLSSMTASETAKVLENSYRATNIAFITEWGEFAQNVGIDLFEVLDAVRMRPTHNNIRQPGFGVGGYCLTKDPLLAPLAAKKLFNLDNVEFPFSRMAVKVNAEMPLNTLKLMTQYMSDVSGKHVLLCGVSYRQDVGDTRYSPTEVLFDELIKRGAIVSLCDPLVDYWPEAERSVSRTLPSGEFDAVVFCVPHHEFATIDGTEIKQLGKPLVIDANNCLTREQIEVFAAAGLTNKFIGRGN